MAVGRYTILTYQARVPVGEHNLPEIPAGMLDGSGHFKGVAAEEMEEECDIVISEEELIDLTELAYGSRWRGMIRRPEGATNSSACSCSGGRSSSKPWMIWRAD